ncbi:surface protease GP63 [Trypanosoma rangeli]|uniref:Leishmanolysin-like peptidase n=1 Tax=Trypanosoma rangeli TaxID=5698 RepID=A0A422NLZ8_TRYRA|nr:surface protease GP63 [Trypanosoma rangeli]RNF06501.1 surface protease GP63 [Trypanosoma rangeli]|eukprot:RNF06501.1 surface protease GP63 [Trypanosoma rangeli]
MDSIYIWTAQEIMTRAKSWVIENILTPLAPYCTQRLFNVKPVHGRLIVTANACGPDVVIPPAQLTTGVTDADMMLCVHAGGTGTSSTPGILGIITWAGVCSTNQFSRPVVGHIIFFPFFIQGSDSGRKYEYYLRVVMRETFYVLRYGPAFLNNMINISERRGKPVLLVTAPAVVTTARAHLNCPTPDGVELEGEGGADTAHGRTRGGDNGWMNSWQKYQTRSSIY